MTDYRPQIPAISRDSDVWTFQDVVDHLLLRLNHDPTARNYRFGTLARQAAFTAYRDLPNRRSWKYFERQTILNTVASQTTGTIEYDHTGGANERQVTLSDATWPSWANLGRLIIGDTHYEIERRVSDTILTLEQHSNPGGDKAAGTGYTIYQAAYALPVNFRKPLRIYDADNEHEIHIVSSEQQHAESIWYYDTPDTPWRAAIRGSSKYLNSQEIVFSPPPDSARQYDLLYEAMPRPWRTEKYSTGTVTTDGTTTVTGSGTAWAQKHVGAVIRFSADSTDEPTGAAGGPGNLFNPAVETRVIQSVTNATTLVVDSAVSTLSGVKYTISDPVDLETSAMLTALLRMAAFELVNGQGDTTEGAGRRYELAKNEAMQALRLAMEADQRAIGSGGPAMYDRFRKPTITRDA